MVHLLLAAGLAFVLLKFVPSASSLARLLGIILLFIFVTPSAVRWIDDGMETGFVLCFVTALCVGTFLQSRRETTKALQYSGFATLAFFIILLRTEILLLCGIAFSILAWPRIFPRDRVMTFGQRLKSALGSSHLLLGCGLALAVILVKMHVLLPDTALAKSDGIEYWRTVLLASAHVLAGALSFGAGLLMFWLLTISLLVRAGRFSPQTLLANAVFPVVLTLSALRGQQIQGARYLVWTFFFSALWNILELGEVRLARPLEQQGNALVYGFVVLLLIALPFESKAMYHVLTGRAQTMKVFEGEHLERLQGKRGIAMDVGYIGYFSKANICDLAGLINGRDQAMRKAHPRADFCVASRPEFLFLNASQFTYLNQFMDLSDWQICSHYDFINVSTLDTHYLLAPRPTAADICRTTSGSAPSPSTELLQPNRAS